MSTELKIIPGSTRCGLCYYWNVSEESDEFVVFRGGVLSKIMFGACDLKTSEPDSECVCACFEERIEVVEDKTVKFITKVMHDANEALIHFKTTGDRSKFKEWLEKYKKLDFGGN